MTDSDKHNNLFAHAQMQSSVNKAFKKTPKLCSITQTQKRQIGGVSTNRLLDVWETLLSFSKYVLSNSFSQNIKYCSVAF